MLTGTWFPFVIFNVIWLLNSSDSFLLSSDCPAPLPCTCAGSISSSIDLNISCEYKNLTTIPDFRRFNATVSDLSIQLSLNILTAIGDNAFRNLSLIKANYISLRLDSNRISSISEDAFNEFENITCLDLRNNALTAIPHVIGRLLHLQHLLFEGNPLRSIDPTVMPNIGSSLTELSLNIKEFSEWPNDFHYLRKLQKLTVNYIPFTHLDVNAFHGFENTISDLRMNHARLQKVPYSICLLTHLSSLSFTYDSELLEGHSSIFEPCRNNLTSVTTLTLYGNQNLEFPDIFNLFPSLTFLDASNNQFDHIKGVKVPDGLLLTQLILSENTFERIPTALNKLKSVIRLDIGHNKIKTVESGDLSGLSNLQYLLLNGNPIVYISPDAFSQNANLVHLNLEDTDLDRVPRAFLQLPNLEVLYLSGRPIDCTCDMDYLRHWNVSSIIQFSTKCALSAETIKHFVSTAVQSCS